MNTLNPPNIDAKNDFRIKFTGADRRRITRNGKEMILGERQRSKELSSIDQPIKTEEMDLSL